MLRRRLLASGLVAIAAVAVPVAHASSSNRAGCADARRAVAHYAGGVRLAHPPQSLVPCATETGFFTGETTIGVTKQGTVWLSAANWEWALARSRDNGAHWTAYNVPGPQA